MCVGGGGGGGEGAGGVGRRRALDKIHSVCVFFCTRLQLLTPEDVSGTLFESSSFIVRMNHFENDKQINHIILWLMLNDLFVDKA